MGGDEGARMDSMDKRMDGYGQGYGSADIGRADGIRVPAIELAGREGKGRYTDRGGSNEQGWRQQRGGIW
jgi:hypothetical protein